MLRVPLVQRAQGRREVRWGRVLHQHEVQRNQRTHPGEPETRGAGAGCLGYVVQALGNGRIEMERRCGMTREEAIDKLQKQKAEYLEEWVDYSGVAEAYDMAIEALQTEPIRCGECKHKDECEEVVLFDVNDDEVMGHRLYWCSYGERKGGEDE